MASADTKRLQKEIEETKAALYEKARLALLEE
jgi:hypothetical protein